MEGEAGEDDRYRAPALDKGLDILERLAADDGGMTLAEIAKALGRTSNEIYRMLDRLVRRGYVWRNEADRYELTLKLFGLAHVHPPLRRLVALATPPMRELAAATGQANHLAVYDRAGVHVIAQTDAPGYWGLAIRVGARVGLADTGSGQVLLAYCSQDERARMLAEQGTDADARAAAASARWADIRSTGHAVTPSRQTAGVQNISAPVLGADGHAVAALTCPYIARLDQPDAPGIAAAIAMVRAAARRVSERIGGRAETEAEAPPPGIDRRA